MKIKTHKWTLALAAAGVVSLPSVANAQEAAAGADALAASTTLTGYVSTSYTMADGDGADLVKHPKHLGASGEHVGKAKAVTDVVFRLLQLTRVARV